LARIFAEMSGEVAIAAKTSAARLRESAGIRLMAAEICVCRRPAKQDRIVSPIAAATLARNATDVYFLPPQ
jgi:hypothetical protein